MKDTVKRKKEMIAVNIIERTTERKRRRHFSAAKMNHFLEENKRVKHSKL
jgi:hypothetical protein